LADAAALALRCVDDAETAHEVAAWSMRKGLNPVMRALDDERRTMLTTSVLGLTVPSPVGVAAGFDKKGELSAALREMGFGFVEVGGVTPTSQDGNPRPRIFRLVEDQALVNRVGLPNRGAVPTAETLRTTRRGVVGVNCAKQGPVDDYATVAAAVTDVCDFLVVNASCPNVRGGVVVDAGELGRSIRLTKRAAKGTPVLVKVSPDVTDLGPVAKVLRREGVDGIVLANTTKRRPDDLVSANKDQVGGLSGRPLADNTKRLVSQFYALTNGTIPIVAVGGVFDGRDAYALVKAGATLVQIYTGLVYRPPSQTADIHANLADLAKADGFATIQAAVGADHRRPSS